MRAFCALPIVCCLSQFATVLSAVPPASIPAEGFYAATKTKVLRFPSAGGVGEEVSTLSPEVPSFYGLDFSPEGNLYGIGGTEDSNRYALHQIDAVTGQTTFIGNTGYTNTRGMAIDSTGTAYALQSSGASTLYRVDLANASTTPIASGIEFGNTGIICITFDNQDRLYGSSNVGTQAYVVELDPISGAILDSLAITGFPSQHTMYGLAFNADNDLFAVAFNSFIGGPPSIWSIDGASGQAQFRGTADTDSFAFGLTHWVPEPTSLWGFAAGTFMLARRRRISDS